MQTFLIIVGCIIGALVLAGFWLYYKLKSLAARGMLFVATTELEVLRGLAVKDYVTDDMRSRVAGFASQVEALPAPNFFNSGDVLRQVLPLIALMAKLAEEMTAANPDRANPSTDEPIVITVEAQTPLALPAPATQDAPSTGTEGASGNDTTQDGKVEGGN